MPLTIVDSCESSAYWEETETETEEEEPQDIQCETTYVPEIIIYFNPKNPLSQAYHLQSSAMDSSDDEISSSQERNGNATFQYEKNYRWPSKMQHIENLTQNCTSLGEYESNNLISEISYILFEIVEEERTLHRDLLANLIEVALNDLEQKYFEEISIYFHQNVDLVDSFAKDESPSNSCEFLCQNEDIVRMELPESFNSIFRPRYDFWIPISTCRSNYNGESSMYDFIPYFGDEKGISKDLSDFLEKTLYLTEPVSAYNQSIHWVICDLIKVCGLHWNILREFFSKLPKSIKAAHERGYFFVQLIKFCFPTFESVYLYDISLDLKKASCTLNEFSSSLASKYSQETSLATAHENFPALTETNPIVWPLTFGFEKAFRFHFCRKCYQLNCALHSDVVFPLRRDDVYNQKENNQPYQSNGSLNSCKILDSPDFGLTPPLISITDVQKHILDKCLSLSFSLPEISQFLNIREDLLSTYIFFNYPAIDKKTLFKNVSSSTPKSSSKKIKNSHSLRKKYPIDIDSEERVPHVPCYHPGRPCDDRCPCVASSLYCEKYCFCSESCNNRFPGCICHGPCRNTVCICYASLRECDPDLCKKCSSCPGRKVPHLSTGEPRIRKRKCQNSSIQNGYWKRLFVARSYVDGLGAFAGEDINESELISEYVGERLAEEEAEKRGRVYDDYGCSYLFKLDRETTIDATVFGAPIRFANHSNTHQNCYAKIVMVNGEYRIGMYANRNILKGEEILFDYGYTKDQRKFVNKTLPPPKS